ncbi:MAG: type II toxin-antitoxin system VapC family toxin [Planctomycetaceae bacterium]|nr:type II toxin-antitoxin system VapC family toxin [Planctomycetaceae bacterium]
MKLLLDTHIVLWFFNNVENLSKKAYDAILDSTNEKFISIASAWELAIKISLDKLVFEGGIQQFFSVVSNNGFELLPIKEKHLKLLEILPLYHRDPFDRILVTSAISEGMHLITADANIHRYDVPCIW